MPAVVITKVLLPQSNIMADFIHSHSNLFSDVSPVLPTYRNHNVIQSTVYSLLSFTGDQLRTPAQNVQLPTHNCKFQSLIPRRKVVIIYASH